MDIPETSFEQTDLMQVELYVDIIPFEQTLDNYFKDLSMYNLDTVFTFLRWSFPLKLFLV